MLVEQDQFAQSYEDEALLYQEPGYNRHKVDQEITLKVSYSHLTWMLILVVVFFTEEVEYDVKALNSNKVLVVLLVVVVICLLPIHKLVISDQKAGKGEIIIDSETNNQTENFVPSFLGFNYQPIKEFTTP